MPLTKIEAGLIANNAVTSDAIATGTVIAADILDGTVDNNKLVTANITGTKLVNSTITGDKIGTGQISGNLLVATVTTGNLNLGGATSFLGTTLESANVTTLMGATTTVNVSAPVVVFTANSSANSTVNFTGLDGVPVGNTASFVIIVPNSSTAKYISVYQVDGSAVTPKWQGGAPTSGTAANTDIYSFTIIKTAATPTYNIFASVASYF